MPSPHAVLTTPVDRFGTRVDGVTGAFPRQGFPNRSGLPGTNGRSASTIFLSRPARASLALRPAELLAHLKWTFVTRLPIPTVTHREHSLAIQAYRQLLEWDSHPLVICAVGARSFCKIGESDACGSGGGSRIAGYRNGFRGLGRVRPSSVLPFRQTTFLEFEAAAAGAIIVAANFG